MKLRPYHSFAPCFRGALLLQVAVSFTAISGAALTVSASTEARHYYSVTLEELPLVGGHEIPESRLLGTYPSGRAWSSSEPQRFPYVWIEGEGEAYVAPLEWTGVRVDRSDFFLAVAAEPGETVQGILFHPLADPDEGFARLPFRMEGALASVHGRGDFLRVKASHYERLAASDHVGGAWFRRQLNDAVEALNHERAEPRTPIRVQRGTSLDQTFDLFSGGRAISENLALDETLEVQFRSEGEMRAVSEIRGITVQEYDWRELLGEPPASLDPLARLMPADQHALFFRDGAALTSFLAEWQENGLPLLSMLDPVSVPAGLLGRYEHQLGISVEHLAELSEKGRIKSIAITGGDPFFATGTDVAILLETDDPLQLLPEFEGKFRAIADRESGVEFTRTGPTSPGLILINPDRSRSARVAVVDGALLVTNSPYQVEAVGRVIAGEVKALADLDEYQFFRARYSRADPEETGFLLLTDDTIRRWCGPEWRIGASRRLRAAALLADLSARNLSALVSGAAPDSPGIDPAEADWLGHVHWNPSNPRSENYNTLGFLTPIAELKIETASAAEARAYETWRRRYEGEWEAFFDPIAIQFSLSPERMKADVTVMPLTASSQYRSLMELAGNVAITAGTGDPRSDALLQVALAVDPESAPMRMLAGMGQMIGADLSYNALGWMGGQVSIYLDESEFWGLLAASRNQEEFLMRNVGRMPAALHIESKDSIRLALFLGGLRTMLEQTAPGMIRWETREHEGLPYIALTPSESMIEPGMPQFSLFYAARPDALVISLREEVIRRSIERFQKRQSGENLPDAEWLGNHLNLRLQQSGVNMLQLMVRDDYGARLRVMAQAPVPLLNDWRNRFPEKDPLELVQTVWHFEVSCPAGGEYVWNDEYKTYESSHLGLMTSARSSESLPAILRDLATLRFGVGFEHDGIRARGELVRHEEGMTPTTIDSAEPELNAIDTGRYFPLTNGAAWTWEEIDSTSGEVARITETVTQRETTEDGELVRIKGTWTMDGDSMDYQSWYSDHDGVRVHRSRGEDYEDVYTPPMVLLPARMVPDQAYRFKSVEESTDEGQTFVTRSEVVFTLATIETVEVKAGRFADCLKIRIEAVSIDARLEAAHGGSEGVADHAVETRWFAPGVGLVKSEWESEWGNGRSELVEARLP